MKTSKLFLILSLLLAFYACSDDDNDWPSDNSELIMKDIDFEGLYDLIGQDTAALDAYMTDYAYNKDTVMYYDSLSFVYYDINTTLGSYNISVNIESNIASRISGNPYESNNFDDTKSFATIMNDDIYSDFDVARVSCSYNNYDKVDDFNNMLDSITTHYDEAKDYSAISNYYLSNEDVISTEMYNNFTEIYFSISKDF